MKSVPPPERSLTNDEIRWLAAYAAMDNEAKQLVLDIAEDMARDFPARKQRPRLRLIAGSPK